MSMIECLVSVWWFLTVYIPIIAAVREVGDNKVAITLPFSTFFNLFLEAQNIVGWRTHG